MKKFKIPDVSSRPVGSKNGKLIWECAVPGCRISGLEEKMAALGLEETEGSLKVLCWAHAHEAKKKGCGVFLLSETLAHFRRRHTLFAAFEEAAREALREKGP